MANIPRVKPAGWAVNEILTSAQANQLDIDHAKAVNGDDGGTWNPSAVVEVGGSGLRLAGTSNLLLVARDIIRYQPLVAARPELQGSTIWRLDTSASPISWLQTATSNDKLVFALPRLLHNGTLKEVHLRWKGGGALPAADADKPTIRLGRVTQDGTLTTLGTTIDNSASYTVHHDISILSLAAVLDLTTSWYFLSLEGDGVNTSGVSASLRVKIGCSSYAEY